MKLHVTTYYIIYISVTPLDCGDPTPFNGLLSNALSGTYLGDTATITCDSGFDISGSSSLTCLETGWNDTSTCIIQSEYVFRNIIQLQVLQYCNCTSVIHILTIIVDIQDKYE